jgi:branched-chain amino acid transport system permease protein
MTHASVYRSICLATIVCATLPLVTDSNTVLNAMVTAMIIALAAQGWNLLGGYGGQLSFGHAVFFGTGAYADALLQSSCGMNAYVALAIATALGSLVGLIIGLLSFRAGLRGSYFALVTLAFAEVFRIVANAAPITGAATGTLIKLEVKASNFQFQSRAIYFWIILALIAATMLLVRSIEQRRFGAYLIAVRENEDAAKSLGVDTLRVKLQAITLSAAMTALAGAFYAQYFLFVDSTIAYGTWISVEALLATIIGGIGTVFGPVLGALTLYFLGEFAKDITGRTPGIDIAFYGALLILVVAFARDGVQGLLFKIAGTFVRRKRAA